jgi:hypothetical protein
LRWARAKGARRATGGATGDKEGRECSVSVDGRIDFFPCCGFVGGHRTGTVLGSKGMIDIGPRSRITPKMAGVTIVNKLRQGKEKGSCCVVAVWRFG